MRQLVVDNFIIDKPLIEIIYDIKSALTTGKLKSIVIKGENIGVTCPAHKHGLEDNISSYIYIGDDQNIEYGYFNCFTCHTQGPFYKFVAECFDVSIEQAKSWLKSHYGIYYDTPLVNLQPIELNAKMSSNLVPKSILNNMQSYHPYMTKRKLAKNICEKFQVKYEPSTNSIVFPVYNERNELVMLTRRNVYTKTFLIPPDVEKPVYLLNAVLKQNYDYVIITEAQIDALTAWGYGSPCVALFGTGSKHQYDIINKCEVKHWVTMFDNDDAGRHATKMFNKNIRKDVFVTNIFIKGNKKDINDLTKEEFQAYLLACNLKINIV